MRPPGLGLDLWSDYVSPRQQAATTTATTPKTPKHSESSGVRFDAHASLSQPPPSPAPSIDEEPPIARAGAAAASADERRIKGASGRRTPTNMFGAVWDWAWHWR
ncbi:hypothetical protein M408DRAFT_326866 [Serendipita vermifera MAFF 305830]|uniref:Uncharacterized protein n=1 Tax=Serendipita vermifera MAFF 305830 TaxID=933852 RepID=A0A0C3BJG7_SERVB|nr:hypothetical protein M408DRAFT_326866 [Serendipita vermifera MAFF 305830]